MGATRRMWALVRRSKVDREIEDELRAHVQMRTEDNIAAGMTPEAAQRDAWLRFGNPTVVKERVTERDAALVVDAIMRDMRYALRGFAKSPGFTSIAIVTLALGIGANTAIFQLLDAVRLRSLPIANPQELAEVKIVGGNHGFGINNGRYAQLTRPVWLEIRDHQDPFSGVFAWRMNDHLIGELSDAHNVRALEVSGAFFSVLGIRPWRGRLIMPDDETSVCTAPRVVVSYPYWKSQMAGRPLTANTRLKIDNQFAEVVGVTPPGFFGMAVGESFDIAYALESTPCDGSPWQRELFDVSVMGRLKADWSLDRASAYFGALSPGIFDATAPTGYSAQAIRQFTSYRLGVYLASEGVSALRADYQDSLSLLLAITGLVLLIACANLANLMLARASARHREMAVRMALGASRGRLLRQLLIESGILAASGALLGLVLAQGFSRFLVRSLSTEQWSVTLPVSTDWRVLLFSAAVAVFTCIVFGTVPALRASNADPVVAMKTGDGRVAGNRERFSAQRIMVVVQISVSMVLLAGALLFVRSFRNLMTLNPGMREHGISVAHIGFPLSDVPRDHYEEFKRQLLEEVRSVPGVTRAATTTNDPLMGGSWTHAVRVDSVEDSSKFTWVSPDYFQTMGIPLLTGRMFAETDTANSPRVAIVNQTFLRHFVGNENPIGKTVRTLPEPNYPATVLEIIGTIPDTKYNDIRGATPPMAFVPAAQFPPTAEGPWMSVMIWSDIAPSTVMAEIKRQIGDKHPNIIVHTFDFETQIHNGLLRERLMAILSGFFGALAALLVMVGLYGVISYFVTLRRNEIGIRVALGATRWQVIALVMRDAGWMLAVGAAIGTTLSLIAGRSASSMLFGLKPYDPATLLFAVGVLAAIAALASWIPARRAAKLDPMAALRCE
ncbi:MAG TPA: ABC transporter permease [Silvibacterium sp.]|nr:ABC transporter permease [Silvibacterium sp.]